MVHTVENIGLDLSSSVAKFVESITGFIGEGTELNWCNNIDEHIILQNKRRMGTKISLIQDIQNI